MASGALLFQQPLHGLRGMPGLPRAKRKPGDTWPALAKLGFQRGTVLTVDHHHLEPGTGQVTHWRY